MSKLHIPGWPASQPKHKILSQLRWAHYGTQGGIRMAQTQLNRVLECSTASVEAVALAMEIRVLLFRLIRLLNTVNLPDLESIPDTENKVDTPF